MGKLLPYSEAQVYLIDYSKYIDFYRQYNILYRLNIITPHFHIREKYNGRKRIWAIYIRLCSVVPTAHINTLSLYTIFHSVTNSFRHSFPNPHWRLLRFDYIGKTFDALKCRLLFCYDYAHCHLYYPVVFHFNPLYIIPHR